MSTSSQTPIVSESFKAKLHPLVLLNLSDHTTRAFVSPWDDLAPVCGILLGHADGHAVEIVHSFEVNILDTSRWEVDEGFLSERLQLYQEVFPTLDLVGWYIAHAKRPAVAAPGAAELNLVRTVETTNPTPLLLCFDAHALRQSYLYPPTGSIGGGGGTMILEFLKCWEKSLHSSGHLWQNIPIEMVAVESERISVEHVTKAKNHSSIGGADRAASSYNTHLSSMRNSTLVLRSKLELIVQYLREILVSGDPSVIHREQQILRDIKRLCLSIERGDDQSATSEQMALAVAPVLLSGISHVSLELVELGRETRPLGQKGAASHRQRRAEQGGSSFE